MEINLVKFCHVSGCHPFPEWFREVTFETMISMALARTPGQTAECTLASGRRIACMGKASSVGLTIGPSRVSTSWTSRKGQAREEGLRVRLQG